MSRKFAGEDYTTCQFFRDPEPYNNCGGIPGGVSQQSIPEPSGWSLMLLMLGLYALKRLRK